MLPASPSQPAGGPRGAAAGGITRQVSAPDGGGQDGWEKMGYSASKPLSIPALLLQCAPDFSTSCQSREVALLAAVEVA